MELAFAGLHQLCAPMLDRLDRLPARSATRLSTAFGLSAGDAPDRFLVGLAVLSLLSEVAEEQPLVCVVDDAQWLDRASAQALAFVARRLLARVGRAGVRGARAERRPELAGLPELVVEGLRDADARALLASVIPGPLDERVRDRIVAETRGNPLALLELPRGLTPAELAGGFGLPDALPLASRIEQSFRRRIERASGRDPAAAADRGGRAGRRRDAAVARGRAARHRGRARRAGRGGRADRARRPGAVPSSAGALRGLPGGARRSDGRCTARWRRRPIPEIDPDRRAWHRAQAAPGPTRRSPTSSSARPAGRRRAAASPPRPRSWSAPPS